MERVRPLCRTSRCLIGADRAQIDLVVNRSSDHPSLHPPKKPSGLARNGASVGIAISFVVLPMPGISVSEITAVQRKWTCGSGNFSSSKTASLYMKRPRAVTSA